MSLTIALATRGRPDLLRRTLEMTLPNVVEPDTRLVVLADDDDAAMRRFRFDGVTVSVAPREDSLGEKFNRVLGVAPADVYLVMVDYAPHVTPGFDREVLRAAGLFPDGIGVVYNHMANLSFPVMNAVTRRWVELAGGIYPGWFPYWFVDHWLDDLARITDRFACADVEVDVSARPGTQEHREPGFWASLYDMLVFERRRVALGIIDALDEPEWRKRVLRSRAVLVEERSAILNARLRETTGSDVTADARYLRIRERALAKMRGIALEIEP